MRKFFLAEKKCAECGKSVFPTSQWVYKLFDNNKTKYYCSWTCFSKNKYGKNKKPKRRRVTWEY